jgi:nitrite reductase (NADH) large subunit
MLKFAHYGPGTNAFEDACGGYGYNAYGVGSRFCLSGYNAQSQTVGMDPADIRDPARTVMFCDAAFGQPYGTPTYLIEYSFAEPPRDVDGNRTTPSIHFRHNGQANVIWCDGHVSAERRTLSYDARHEAFNLGWFGTDLQTSLPDIYAAGDVAEHNGQTYGSWAASQYQGRIAALNMAGIPTSFGGLPRANSIKALGLDLTSIGRFQPEDGSFLAVEEEHEGVYLSFVFKDGRMVGAILVGRSDLAGLAKKAVESGADFARLLQKEPDCAAVIERLERL